MTDIEPDIEAAIKEIRRDMREATGSDALFLKVFGKHRRCRIGGIDHEIREVEHAVIRAEFKELAERRVASSTSEAIEILSRRHGKQRRWLYYLIFHKGGKF